MMKRLLTWLACCVPALCAFAMSPAELFARNSPSIWVVHTYDSEGLPLSQGSAVVTAPGRLITNCHVLDKARRLSVSRGRSSLPASLEMWDQPRDLCQLNAPGLDAPPVEMGSSDRLVVGQTVYAIGAPKALELTLSAGLVSSLRRDSEDGVAAIQISAPISHGSSGGGLFDEQGRLIGITSAGIEGGQNLNFAVPVGYLAELPQRFHGKLFAQGGANGAIEGSGDEAPAAMSASAEHAGDPRSLTDPVPFLGQARQEVYREKFLKAPLPRAVAISSNGALGYASGLGSQSPGLPNEPSERALQMCAEVAGKACLLYAVDNQVVFHLPGEMSAVADVGSK